MTGLSRGTLFPGAGGAASTAAGGGRLHRRGMTGVEFGHIRAGWQLNADGVVRAPARIIDAEPFPDLAGLDPDGGIVARIVTGRPAEDFDADGPLLEHVAMAVQRVIHHVVQEILAAFAGPELVAGQDAVQFLAHLFLG